VLTRRYSELAREKMWSRIHLIPLLQAEEDRDLVRRSLADKAREKELLGAETKIYNTDRYRFSTLLFIAWADSRVADL
jgi:NADH dehydrogenase (ubiquinone) 1 alpha subcomplex subunit 13